MKKKEIKKNIALKIYMIELLQHFEYTSFKKIFTPSVP